MKRTFAPLALLPLVSCVFVAVDDDEKPKRSHAAAAHDHDGGWVDFGDDPMSNPEFTAAMMAAAVPGEPHAELAKGVGDYDVTGTMWMGPDQSMPMEGTAHTEMVLGGRYLMQEFESSFMGQPYQGLMLMGYDNLTDRYWNIWVDSASTGYSLAHGHDRGDGELVMAGTMRDPMTPHGRPFRTVTDHVDADTFTMAMFDTLPEGGEFKVMELTYRKR